MEVSRFCEGCGKPPLVHEDGVSVIPLKRCTRCRQTSYHGSDCQRRHYKDHKAACRKALPHSQQRLERVADAASVLFQVQERNDKEKCLKAVRNVNPGQALISADGKPYFRSIAPPVLFHARRKTYCAVCFNAVAYSTGMTLMSEDPRYPVTICSEACRERSSDWLPQEVSAATCVLQSYYPTTNNSNHVQILPTALLVYRLLVRFVTWDDIMGMQSHKLTDYLGDDDPALAHQQAVTTLVLQMILKTDGLADRIMRPDVSSGISCPSDLVTEVLNRIKCNAFTITNIDALGLALYEAPSYRINHSCVHNAVQSFLFAVGELPRLRIDICRPIEAGQEVCISYIDCLESPVRIRRETLAKDYCFHCRCPRCEAEENGV